MPAIILPGRRNGIHAGPLDVNWGDSITTGLVSLIVMRESGPVDLVSRNMSFSIRGTPEIIGTEFGLAAKNVDGAEAFLGSAIANPPAQGTLVCLSNVQSAGSGGGGIFTLSYSNNAESNPYHAISLKIGDTVNDRRMYFNVGSGRVAVNVTSVGYALGEWEFLVGRVKSGSQSLWVSRGHSGEILSSSDTAAGSIAYGTGPRLIVGEDWQFGSPAGRAVVLGALWDRYLSDGELLALRSDYSRLLAKRKNILYFPSAGGGGATITAGSGSFALTGTAVSLKANRVLAAASGSFALTGSDVSLRVGRKLAADSGTYSLTGTDVAFKRGYALSAESGTYTLNGTDVSLKAGRKLTADSGTYALTGTNVTLTHNSAGSYTLVAESGSYSLTGTAVSLTVNRKLAADSGTYALTGSNATLTKGYTLTAASGTYTLTGSNVAFARTYRLTAESGAYTLTGSNASIVWSGAPVDSGPDTSGGGSGPRVLLRERKVREEVDEWLAKKAQADLLKKIQREDEEICLIMALLAA